MAVQAGDGFSRALSTAEFSVGTDCSGLEAPVLALQAMNIPHKHAFSCDVNPKIRQHIRANMPHAKVFDDICHRDHREVPPHNVNVCGFPCQPFSVLDKSRRLLRDSRAKAFFAMLNTLRACLPALAILENVLGIRTVLDKVWGHLHALKMVRGPHISD
jgi:site-specific DNA-cytosine methylase